MRNDLIDFANQSKGFLLNIEAKIEENSIEYYIKDVNSNYCKHIKSEKDKIVGININDIDDEFRDVYYQLMNYIFENKTKDILDLYVKKDDGNIDIIDVEKDYMCNIKGEFYQITACSLEQTPKFLKVLIIVRDYSREIKAFCEIKKALEINNYNDKMMNISGVLSNLSHSWRQPLNSLNFSIINLIDEIDDNTEDNELVEEYYCEIWQIISSFSYEIEKFKTFFEMNYSKKFFNINEYLNLVFDIMEEKIKRENIQIHINAEKDVERYGSPNEFVQIMYCIFFDIIEYCKVPNISDRILSIDINKDENNIFIVIKVIFDRKRHGDFKLCLKHMFVFKNIIQEHMNGTIDLINDQTESKVIISFFR